MFGECKLRVLIKKSLKNKVITDKIKSSEIYKGEKGLKRNSLKVFFSKLPETCCMT